MVEESNDKSELEQLKAEGNNALARIYASYQERLERIVVFRMDPRIRRRIDAADVLQEAYLEMDRRLPDYVADPKVSVLIWMRQRVLQKLIDMQREQFRDKRDINKEQQPAANWNSGNTSLSVNAFLAASITSPSQFLIRNEDVLQLQSAMDSLSEIDREVIALRHFEQLTNQQVAEVLSLSTTAASNRYIRALTRLSDSVVTHPSGGEEKGEEKDGN
jgi:RNA polymerase sigma-70 factor (ECF subfamily)